MYNISRVTDEFHSICRKAGVEVTSPIRLNGRLTRTLGRVHIERTGEEWNPTLVEFSKQLLETSSDASIAEVIAHEAAHYIVTVRTHESHGHDKVFKAVCAEIGTSNDGTSTKVERTVAESSIYKYQVWCEECEEFVAGYSRMCKTLKQIDFCSCNKCGTSRLKVIQNW